MNYPEYIEVNGKRYKINTDFRIAIECDEIARDNEISDYERALAIIFLLFGNEALKDMNNHKEMLRLAKIFLCCGKEIENSNNGDEPDMNFKQDMDYIEASFMSDYGIDLPTTKIHWWKFYNLINGLSNSELGNCCVLNRIRNLRNFDVKKISDYKEKEKIKKAQKQVALKKQTKKRVFNESEKKNMDDFYNEINV